MPRRIRISSKPRFYIFLTVLMILTVTLISSVIDKGSAAGNISWFNVYVKEGDSLWSIAKETLPKGKDIREYIIEIKRTNNLENANIIAGQYLKIPVYQGG